MSLEIAEAAQVAREVESSRLTDWRKLIAATACFSFGFGLYHAIIINFLVEVIHIRPEQFGVMEAIRETAGFLTAFSGAATMRVAEPLLASGCLALLATGVAGYYFVGKFYQAVGCSFTWSIGFHLLHPVTQSMNLALAQPGQEGRQLGLLRSFGDFATLTALAFVFLVREAMTFQQLFMLSACTLLVGAIVVSTISRDIGHPQKPRLVFKKEYGLYYWLAFLEGCRKQFFITFAPYVLIRAFGLPRERMAMLMFINATLSLLLAPRFGRWIDRMGERRILTMNYVALVAVFIGYSTIQQQTALSALYCADSVLFFFAAALTTYMKKIAIPEDVMPTLAMGVTVNHVAAVIVPLIGGYLWSRFDYPFLFGIGTFFAIASLVSVQRLRN